jgi:hypothetical protein
MSDNESNDTGQDDTNEDDTGQDTESNDSDQDDSGSDEGSSNPDVTTSDTDSGVSDEEAEQLEKERQERLDPDNRPTNAVVDNTGREFDGEKDDFTYAPGEEPDGKDHAQAVIGADRPDGVESDADDD